MNYPFSTNCTCSTILIKYPQLLNLNMLRKFIYASLLIRFDIRFKFESLQPIWFEKKSVIRMALVLTALTSISTANTVQWTTRNRRHFFSLQSRYATRTSHVIVTPMSEAMIITFPPDIRNQNFIGLFASTSSADIRVSLSSIIYTEKSRWCVSYNTLISNREC